MRTKYHVAFKLGNLEKKPDFDSIINKIKSCVPEVLRCDDFEKGTKIITDDYILETISIEKSNFGLSLTTHSERNPEVLNILRIGLSDNYSEKEIDVKVLEVNTGRFILPPSNFVYRPEIVYEILKEFGGYEFDYPIFIKPVSICCKNLEKYCDFIKSTTRVHPAIFISKTFYDDKHLIKPHETAIELAGLAYVFFQKDDVTRKIESILGQGNSCYDGAVKIYWPDYTSNFNVLWKKEILMKTPNFEKKLLSIIAQSSVLMRGYKGFDEIYKMKLKKEMDNNSDFASDYIKYLENETNKLKDDVTEKEIIIETLNDENWRLKQQVSHYEKSEKIIKHESGDLLELEEEEQKQQVYKNVEEAVNSYISDYPKSKVIIDTRVNRMIRNSEFKNPNLVYDSLKWLNEVYIPSRVSGGNDLVRKCYEEIKMEYNANQPIFMKRYDDYNINYEGKTVFMEEHLKKGTTHDPKFTLRICFYYDDIKQKVIVGYIGQHPKVGGI